MTFEEKYNEILTSKYYEELRNYSNKEFNKYKNDLKRLVYIFKTIAHSRLNEKRAYNGTLPDNSLNRTIMFNETIGFYEFLDKLTNYKHHFTEKVKEQIPYIKFDKGRSAVNLSTDNSGKINKIIYLDDTQIINNRTVAQHEAWHAISQKDYKPKSDLIGKDYQFTGEIGSVFIENLAGEYIKKNSPTTDNLLASKLDYQKKISHKLSDINKASDAYLDALILYLINGTDEEKRWAKKEIVDEYGNLWGKNTLDDKLNALTGKRFDYMYEGRYIISSIINEAFEKSNIPLSKKVDLMAELNDNIVSLNNLNKNGSTSDLDILTNHFGLEKIELLAENYAKVIKSTPNISFDLYLTNEYEKQIQANQNRSLHENQLQSPSNQTNSNQSSMQK